MRMRTSCVILFALCFVVCSLYANAAESPLNEKEMQTLNSFKMHRTAGGAYYYTMTTYHDYANPVEFKFE